VRREFLQRLPGALQGTLGSYIRDALQEGSANAVACHGRKPFGLMVSTTFFCKEFFLYNVIVRRMMICSFGVSLFHLFLSSFMASRIPTFGTRFEREVLMMLRGLWPRGLDP
jgi:hypothetical protein